MEKKGRWSCLSRLGSDQREAAKEDPEGEPPADPEEGCLEDPLPVVALDLEQDLDQEQVGRLGLLGECLPKEEEEGHLRLEKVGGLGVFALAEKEARGAKSPRVGWWYGASTLIYKNFCGHD